MHFISSLTIKLYSHILYNFVLDALLQALVIFYLYAPFNGGGGVKIIYALLKMRSCSQLRNYFQAFQSEKLLQKSQLSGLQCLILAHITSLFMIKFRIMLQLASYILASFIAIAIRIGRSKNLYSQTENEKLSSVRVCIEFFIERFFLRFSM